MQIRRVIARNFRGIRHADWSLPRQRFVCLVGPGDSTKTTLLDAIALVLSPRWTVQFTDADFHRCDVSQPIVLQLLIGDLDDTMLADSAFGLDLCGLAESGQLLHDPVDGAEECVLLQLRVDEDLEAEWTVMRPGSTETTQPLTASKRKALGLFRIDERVDTHLRWGRGSALTRLTETSGASQAVTLAGRAARNAVFDASHTALQAAADTVALAASSIGGAAYTGLRPGWDPLAVASTGALLLHEGAVPLTHAGLGTRRLTSIAVQEGAALNGHVMLVDEIEQGLEPHRLLHVLHRVKQRAIGSRGQVIVTTHSPSAVQALETADICVVRSTAGETTVRQVPDVVHDAQSSLRACPSAVLARKVIVGEGKTEVGMVRHLMRAWDTEQIDADQPTHAALGVALADGGGKTAPVRAKVFQDLGFSTLLLVDNDDPNFDADIATATHAGVAVIRWQAGHSTEAEITSALDIDGLSDLLQLAAELSGEDPVRDAVVAKLDRVPAPGQLSPASWLEAGHALPELQRAVAAAAGKKAWFKREDPGERLGAFVLDHWDQFKGVALGHRLADLHSFIYGDSHYSQ
ncbi:ATP-dependent endonuclease [Micromonospora arida]|uniref:ATP-dependent nuclease n=1 Tax=Micromonospora TaxID=1873 RepID=UPI003698FB4D